MSHPAGVSEEQVKLPVITFVETLKAGEHGCMFFRSKKRFQTLQFAFLKSGLEQNWGAVYATATEPTDSVKIAMRESGIDVQKYEGDGSLLIVRGEDLYKNAENPDLQGWTDSAKRVCDNFIAKGKKGARVAADLSSYFLRNKLTKQWFQLEYILEKRFSLPLTVICGYDASNVPASSDLDIIDYYKFIRAEKKEYIDSHSFAIYDNDKKSLIFTI